MQLPKSDSQKLKILYILDYLQKNSHQDHPVRASELVKMLEGHGILCDRKTVYSDIAALTFSPTVAKTAAIISASASSSCRN